MDKLTWFLAALAVVQTLLLLVLWRRPATHRPDEGADDARVARMLAAIDRVERGVREEHRTGRGEAPGPS